MCSSDLWHYVPLLSFITVQYIEEIATHVICISPSSPPLCRSEERRVGKSVDLGGRRIIKKKTIKKRIPKNLLTNNMYSSFIHLETTHTNYDYPRT